MTRSKFSALAAICCLSGSPLMAGERFRDATAGFSVEIPDCWVSVSPEVVTQINSSVATFLKIKVAYLACLVPNGHTSVELPRILIQFQAWDGGIPTYDALEESLKNDLKTAVTKIKKEPAIAIHSLELGEAALDRKSNRIMMRLQAAVAGEGTVHGLSLGMLGKHGIVFLHCYASADKFRRSAPLFEYFAETFRFNPGMAYDPAEATVTSLAPRDGKSKSASFSWFGASRGGMIGGIVGGVIGTIAVVVRSLRRRFA